MGTAIVIGAGAGIGLSVARRIAREGLPVGVIARGAPTVASAVTALSGHEVQGVAADAADEAALRHALDEIADRLGPPELLVYNVALIRRDAIGELSAAQHLDAWAVNVVGAISAAAHVAPGMAERGRGTIVITGGMPEPVPAYTSLSLGKAGVRTLVSLLHEAYGGDGVHAASVTVTGEVAPGTAYDPDDIAEHYWRLHVQPRGAWEHEVFHGPRLPQR
ncbi:MAG TPA: SDR family NAD(P)-dependent oxidoreductase [Solirubrobacteraceae bacterium]|nr:SDR family NAD(P)-dependent oxidoreductase [Solirubrobacteraceae bacterium]